MDEHEDALPDEGTETAGSRLRAAREAAGLGLADIAARTKISERHLAAIEEDRLSELAGRTYAIGFTRAYARAVGADEAWIADAVKDQLDREEEAQPRVHVETFEPGDPARVPPARLAWAAAIGGVIAVLVLLALFWPSFLAPQGSLPSLLAEEKEVARKAPPAPAARPAQPAGAVVFTATEPRVWVKFYDAAGNQLFQKEMGEGERYTVPPGAEGPLLWTARPDALEITIGGKPVAKLSAKPETMKDVPVSAAALAARTRQGAPVSTDSAPDSTVSR
jgi:cytoskeleton protein RodZ